MIVPVIIFFGRRQYEPRACDHPADRLARAVHPETAVRRKMDKPVVGADFRLVGRARHVERVYPVTDSGCLVPAETADGHREEFVVRHVEPAASRKEREQVEEDGSGIAHACQSRPAFSRSVAHPYADRIARGCPDRPGVPPAIARPRFPGHLLHGAELLPVRLFFRAVQCRHRFEGEPDGGGGEERLVRKPFVGDRADRVGRRSRVRSERMNIRRVIPPVVSPVMCERTRQ